MIDCTILPIRNKCLEMQVMQRYKIVLKLKTVVEPQEEIY